MVRLSRSLNRFPVFLHFFDIHFLEELGNDSANQHVQDELRLATRLAITCAERVLVPASSYVESPICRQILEEFRDLFASGVITLVGSATNFEEFSESKLTSYRTGSDIFRRYQAAPREPFVPAFHRKQASTTEDLRSYWVTRGQSEDTFRNLVAGTGVRVPDSFEKDWELIPERLGDLAFVVDHLADHLKGIQGQRTIRNRLHTIVNEGYFASYTRELGATVISDLIYLGRNYRIPVKVAPIPYFAVISALRTGDPKLWKKFRQAKGYELVKLGRDSAWLELIARASGSGLPGLADGSLIIGPPDRVDVDVLIVTALEEERQAFHAIFPNATRKTESDHPVYFADLAPEGDVGILPPLRIVFMNLPHMGRVPAATSVTKLLYRFKPQSVLLVGIAGGIKERVNLGDVIVADQIIDYEQQKIRESGPEQRPQVYRASQFLLNRAKNLGAGKWINDIKFERPGGGVIKHHIGPVASGEKIIEYVDFLRHIVAQYPKLLGIEMEGGGAAYAIEASNPRPEFLMLRGISDLADKDKGDPGKESWRTYACHSVAAFAIALLTTA